MKAIRLIIGFILFWRSQSRPFIQRVSLMLIVSGVALLNQKSILAMLLGATPDVISIDGTIQLLMGGDGIAEYSGVLCIVVGVLFVVREVSSNKFRLDDDLLLDCIRRGVGTISDYELQQTFKTATGCEASAEIIRFVLSLSDTASRVHDYRYGREHLKFIRLGFVLKNHLVTDFTVFMGMVGGWFMALASLFALPLVLVYLMSGEWQLFIGTFLSVIAGVWTSCGLFMASLKAGAAQRLVNATQDGMGNMT